MTTVSTDKHQELIEKIEQRVKLAQENPELPFTFYVKGKYDPSITDAKDKRNSMGDMMYPSVSRIVMDKDGQLKEHILMFRGNDDIFNGAKVYTNEKGRFEEPSNLDLIKFTNGQKLVYGDSLKNLNLIRYLSYCEMFQGSVACRDVTTPVKLSQITTEDIVKYATLVDTLAKTDEGFELIKSIAKNTRLNPGANTVEGIAKMEDGKARIVSIVKNFISVPTQFHTFVSLIIPSELVMKQTQEFLQKGIVGYNKATKSYQVKTGDGFAKEVIFTTSQENEATKMLLFAHFLQKNGDWKAKLQNMLDATTRKG